MITVAITVALWLGRILQKQKFGFELKFQPFIEPTFDQNDNPAIKYIAVSKPYIFTPLTFFFVSNSEIFTIFTIPTTFPPLGNHFKFKIMTQTKELI